MAPSDSFGQRPAAVHRNRWPPFLGISKIYIGAENSVDNRWTLRLKLTKMVLDITLLSVYRAE